ncbi:MAG TPA: glycosyltransferase [Longimicrobiales bacterium]|nr:glycosyltransferase [Longimicrobiales bacterium]
MGDELPLVSIITIFLNGEAFIEEAIASVFSQSCKRWELLLVDDGSSDRSSDTARHYAARYPDRVRYLEHPSHANRGMSASRNLGLASARGEYVAFLDADDVYLPLKLEKQVRLLDDYPEAAMVYGATRAWHSWSGRPEDDAHDWVRTLGVAPDSLIEPPELAVRFLDGRAMAPSTCGVLIRRRDIEELGCFQEDFRTMYEEFVLFFKICLKRKVYVHSGTYDLYRQHADSTTRAAITSGEYRVRGTNRSYEKFLRWLDAYLDEEGIRDRRLLAAVNRELRPFRYRRTYRAIGAFDRLRRRVRRSLRTLAVRVT